MENETYCEYKHPHIFTVVFSFSPYSDQWCFMNSVYDCVIVLRDLMIVEVNI